MSTILRLDCSPAGAAAQSARAADLLVDRLLLGAPATTVRRRELGVAPPPWADMAFVCGMFAVGQPGAADLSGIAVSEALIGELEATDVLVIATPMHNFTVPAPLKAWIDQVVRIGRTFRSTPQGKVGLLRDRPAHVVVACGGYLGPPPRQPDFLSPYLRHVLATIGIHDVRFHMLEGLGRGDAAREAAMTGFREAIAAIGA